MIIAHIADIHIGVGRNWKKDLNSENPFYLQRHRTFLDLMTQELQAVKPGAIILGGDLLDCSKPTAKEYELLAYWLHQLKDIAPVHIIAGNHEVLYDGVTALHPAQAFMDEIKNVFWHIDGLEIAKEEWGSTLWASYHATRDIPDALRAGPVDYVVAHYAAKGCVYENGLEATKGWEIQYPGVKHAFIGDIHARQNIFPNATYCGSPCQLNFGEQGSKGFDLFDTETGKLSQVVLKGGIPLITVRITDGKLPEFNPGALYKVFANRDSLALTFPENVVVTSLLESKTTKQDAEELVKRGEIDFGDPLGGLEGVLTRSKLAESILPLAVTEARNIALKVLGA